MGTGEVFDVSFGRGDVGRGVGPGSGGVVLDMCEL